MSALISVADRAIDGLLVSISESFRFLVALTPVNAFKARAQFLADPAREPAFEYQELGQLPARIKAGVKEIDPSRSSDATIAHLFERKRQELRLQADMLATRNTKDFLSLSLELSGATTPELVSVADRILSLVPRSSPTPGQCLNAWEVAAHMRSALQQYRPSGGLSSVSVAVRDDVAGILVSNGDVLISQNISVPSSRLTALVAHEIDTHVLTYINGRLQPLRLLAAGLAGYEESQEGLALTAEVAVEGLTGNRLRQIAARVIAVHRLVQGAGFIDVHRELTLDHGFSPSGAFGITMRVFRSGGLTKDAGYLRGLQAMTDYLAAGGDLASLWVGKLALPDLPLVEDLIDRALLSLPPVVPLFLTDQNMRQRVSDFTGAVGLRELIGAET